jgi:hypothetical protein
MEERKVVLIEWDDIVSTGSDWDSPEERLNWSNSEPSVVRQIGFLLDKDENYITLCCSYLPPEYIGTCVRIPIPAVKYIKELTIDEFKTIQ